VAVERLYRVREAAQVLGVSRMTLYRAIESGALRPTLVGSQMRVKESDLAAYVEALPTPRTDRAS
jgi:excisionase family DNA binding protein